jgi:hypothetical protein
MVKLTGAVLLAVVTGCASQPRTWDDPPKGLEFLQPVPELRGVNLQMNEREFVKVLRGKAVTVQKDVREDGVGYHVHTRAGENVVVMFDREGACRGIQRLAPDAPVQ